MFPQTGGSDMDLSFITEVVNDLCLCDKSFCEEGHVLSGYVLACKSSDANMAEFQPVDGTLIPDFNPNL